MITIVKHNLNTENHRIHYKMIQILLPLAFIPFLVLLIWIRNTEKNGKEPWASVAFAFFWGATIATTMSLVVEEVVSDHIIDFFILSVIIAPIIEEFTKPLALHFIKKEINEIEDGLIFGMVAGFGFAATENLLYGMKFWNEGFIVLISLFYLRTIGSGFLHASATALTGYGYGLKVIKKRPFKSILPFFLIAIAIHSIFNLFALSSQITNQIFGTVIAATFAVTLLILIRKKVLILDRKSMHLEIQ